MFLVLAPVFGGLVTGVDRVVSARMQARVGPPLLQPFYDVGKLLQKNTKQINPIMEPILVGHLIFMAATGVLLLSGTDLIFTTFVFALAALLLVLAAGSANSPFSFAGAERELVVLLASEPFFILMMVAICKVTGVSSFGGVLASAQMVALQLPGVLIAFLLVATIKLRKSPFDISVSHHPHQELVSGLTSDMSGRLLAYVELAHWYESALLCAFMVLLFNWSPVLGLAAFAIAYRPRDPGRQLHFEDEVAASAAHHLARDPGLHRRQRPGPLPPGKVKRVSFFSRSPWILHYDGSSCNGCDIEVLACLTPLYDVERFGVINTGNPKHADILLVTGSVNERNIEIVKNLYRQMPDPKVVVAVGRLRLLRRHLRPGLQHPGRHRQGHPRGRVRARLRRAARKHHRRRGGRASPPSKRNERRRPDGQHGVPRPRRGLPQGRLAAGADQRDDHRGRAGARTRRRARAGRRGGAGAVAAPARRRRPLLRRASSRSPGHSRRAPNSRRSASASPPTTRCPASPSSSAPRSSTRTRSASSSGSSSPASAST